jgi:hypothetical protein
MERGHVLQVEDKLQAATAPRLKLRGHQLGYRPKVNAYDAFTVDMYDQYIRDLAIFGTNSIELIPPRSDDADDSPHFPLPKIEMMEEVSRICDRYGLDVWIWYPAMDKDYSDPATVEFALKELEGPWRRKLTRISIRSSGRRLSRSACFVSVTKTASVSWNRTITGLTKV